MQTTLQTNTHQQNITNVKNFQTLFQYLKIDKNYKEAIKQGMNNYHIYSFKINKLKIQQVPQLLNLIQINYINLDKQQSDKQEKKRSTWLPNQLKLFVWMLVCYSYIMKKSIQNFIYQDWQFFSSIFTRKTSEQLQFQSKSIIKNYHGNKQKWNQLEEQLLISIIQEQNSENRWNQISKLLYFKSKKQYYRSSQKCREYWFNHLDPKLNKNPWTIDQDLRLVSQLQTYGYKWSKITQVIEQKWGYRRTQHMVKNRAKYLCKKYGFNQQKQLNSQKQLKLMEKRLNQQKIKQIKQTQQQLKKIKKQQIKQKTTHQTHLQNLFAKFKNHQLWNQLKQQNYSTNEIKKQEIQNEQNQLYTINKTPQNNNKSQQLNNQIKQKQQKINLKRSVIILCQNSKTKINQEQKQQNIYEEQQQNQIIIKNYHNRNENNFTYSGVRINQNINQNLQEQSQSFYDQYRIIQEVNNTNLDFNQDMKFNHQAHGGQMRQRVTHQLAEYFNNFNNNNNINNNKNNNNININNNN